MFEKKYFYFSTFIIIFLSFIFSGCAKKPEEEIVARINNYELTKEDFLKEAKSSFKINELYMGEALTPHQALNEIITKKILLQEAQKENLDKEKDFMKEIELYWEQTLLKRLILKKTREFSQKINISDKEAKKYYEKKRKKIYAFVSMFETKKAAEYILKNGFENLKNVQDKLIYGEKPEWYKIGDLPNKLEKILFSLTPGKTTNVINFQNKYIIMKILKVEKTSIPPFESIKSNIIKELKQKKTEKMLDNWIKNLRKNARIYINKEILKKIKIE